MNQKPKFKCLNVEWVQFALEQSSVAIWPRNHLHSPRAFVLSNGTHPFSVMQHKHLFSSYVWFSEALYHVRCVSAVLASAKV